jgi:hypothetical protein
MIDNIMSTVGASFSTLADDAKDWAARNAKWVVAGLTVYLTIIAVRRRV